MFREEILNYIYFPVFDVLLPLFRTELGHYEVKLNILQILIPIMKKNNVEKLFRYVSEVLSEPSDQSIFKHNLNPFRVGLILYKVIWDLQDHFNYSQFTAEKILD